ncbi:MAG: hypothetical protein Q9163_002207, partial [Psora crenata]
MSEAQVSSGSAAKLIVTVYAKDRPKSSQADSICTVADPTDALLLAVSPSLQKLETKPLTACIRQEIYSLRTPPPTPDLGQARLHDAITRFERDRKAEVVLDAIPSSSSESPPPGHRPVRLALFDMDSTLINEEVIDELARTIGKTEAVSAITARAMNGELDFETSLRERVTMLRGVRSDVWDELKGIVTIAEGARELVHALKKMGVVTGVVS